LSYSTFSTIILVYLSYFCFCGYDYGVKHHFQQYFSYIVAVSIIGGGNKSTQRKPLTWHKSLTNFIT